MDSCLWDVVSVSPCFIPVTGERLQEPLDDSGLAGRAQLRKVWRKLGPSFLGGSQDVTQIHGDKCRHTLIHPDVAV